MFRVEWQWPGSIVFTIAFICISVLVYVGKIPHETLLSLLAWLVPSPIQQGGPKLSQKQETTASEGSSK